MIQSNEEIMKRTQMIQEEIGNLLLKLHSAKEEQTKLEIKREISALYKINKILFELRYLPNYLEIQIASNFNKLKDEYKSRKIGEIQREIAYVNNQLDKKHIDGNKRYIYTNNPHEEPKTPAEYKASLDDRIMQIKTTPDDEIKEYYLSELNAIAKNSEILNLVAEKYAQGFDETLLTTLLVIYIGLSTDKDYTQNKEDEINRQKTAIMEAIRKNNFSELSNIIELYQQNNPEVIDYFQGNSEEYHNKRGGQ